MNIQIVKTIFEKFAVAEAKAFSVDNIPDLEAQNKAFYVMHEYVVPEMYSNLGITRLDTLKSPLVYRLRKGMDNEHSPRLVLKISQYSHLIINTFG
jgi:hypothetical protein